MAKINANKFVQFISPEMSDSIVFMTVVQYATLKQKIDDPAEQSWYFKKGIESQLKRIKKLNTEFELIREFYNQTDVDTLIQLLKEEKEQLEIILNNKTMSRMIRSILINSKNNSINYYHQLLALKSKIDVLQSIDYYAENPKEFEKLM
jgi:hypothetical protein